MNKLLKVLAVLFLVALTAPAMADLNQNDPNIITFDIGTTATSTAAASAIFRIPQDAVIDSIYVTNLSTMTASSTDYATVTFVLNNTAYGTITTAATAITAVTPRALTPTALILHAGDVVQVAVTKTGGVATTNMGVTLAYHNASH
jgi:hypothetical protein